MIASTQIANTKIFAFIAFLVFKLLSPWLLKRQKKLLKIRLIFKKIANFTVKLLQNYEYLECEIFNFIKKRLQQRCFPVNIAKFLRTLLYLRTAASKSSYRSQI